MDEKLKMQLLKLVSPDSILPNLRLTRPFQAPQKTNLNNDMNKKDFSEEVNCNQAPDEFPIEPPLKKKTCNFSPPSKTSCKYHGMRSRDFRSLIQGGKVIEFCQEIGLIAREVTCSCGNQMRLKCRSGGDGFRWVCYRGCHGSKQNKSIRKGTWFEKSNLSISDILWIVYMWVYEYSYVSFLHECDHSNSTVMTWCTLCLEMCQKIIESKTNPIGGKIRSVEIFHCEINEDEQLGRQWAFCAIEQNSTNSLHIIIDDKTSSTLLQIFEKYILPGTKVIANNWSLLKNLNENDFEYLTLEKSISFIDLETNEIIDTFDVFKMRTNRPNKQDEWSDLKHDPHFFEKMYRKSLAFAPDAFLEFLKDIAMMYKPWDKYCTCFIEVVDYKSKSMKSHKCTIEHHVNTNLE